MKLLHLWVEEYLEFCRVEKGLAENSIAAYGRDLMHLMRFSEERLWESGPREYL